MGSYPVRRYISPHQRPPSCYLVFDERMALHRPPPCLSDKFPIDETDQAAPASAVPFENSSRIIRLHDKMRKLEHRLLKSQSPFKHHPTGLFENPRRFIQLQPEPCPRSTILLAHSAEHYEKMAQTEHLSDQELKALCAQDADLYYCRDTFLAASLAAGGVVAAVNAVMNSNNDDATRAIALVRPPGHHATRDAAMGFCYFNNVAIAAKHAIHTQLADRVLILDWDIHHGNGTQDITYHDKNIFCINLHRGGSRRKDWFYPGTGKHNEVGAEEGAGTNLNIVWDTAGMGNTEYAAAFSELVLPVLSAFDPDLILVSCGFDAAKGDSLGDCKLTPDMYYIMTNSLLDEAGRDTPIVMALEGGYDLDTIAACMETTALALLDEPLTVPPPKKHDVVDFRYQSYCNPFSLSRYWRQGDLMWGNHKKPKRTIRAVASIQKSARALLNKQREAYLGGIRYMALKQPPSTRKKRGRMRIPRAAPA